MKFSESLKKNRDFQQVYSQRDSKANRYLILYKKENGSERNRVGISVSKKVGNSVVRHRVKRLIRESYRRQEAEFPRGLDLVIIARPAAKDKSFAEIDSALMHLGRLHHIIDVESGETVEKDSH